jgi:hypothetical protein
MRLARVASGMGRACEGSHVANVSNYTLVIYDTCDGAHSHSYTILRNFAHINRQIPV